MRIGAGWTTKQRNELVDDNCYRYCDVMIIIRRKDNKMKVSKKPESNVTQSQLDLARGKYRIIQEGKKYFVQYKVFGLFWAYEISLSDYPLEFDTQQAAENFIKKLLVLRSNSRVAKEY